MDSFEWLATVRALTGLAFRIESPPAFATYCRDLSVRRAAAGQ